MACEEAPLFSHRPGVSPSEPDVQLLCGETWFSGPDGDEFESSHVPAGACPNRQEEVRVDRADTRCLQVDHAEIVDVFGNDEQCFGRDRIGKDLAVAGAGLMEAIGSAGGGGELLNRHVPDLANRSLPRTQVPIRFGLDVVAPGHGETT